MPYFYHSVILDSVCVVALSEAEAEAGAGPGRFGSQPSSTDLYHTMP